jgi:hypothetical protein
VKLPATLLADVPELKAKEKMAALLDEWTCALDPGALLRTARMTWFEDRSGHFWEEAVPVCVDWELVALLRTAADEQTRDAVGDMVKALADQLLEPAPSPESQLPVILRLAVLGTLLGGAGVEAAGLRDALRSRRVWYGRDS